MKHLKWLNKNTVWYIAVIVLITVGFVGCSKREEYKKTEINVFLAASLDNVIMDLTEKFNEENPDIKINLNADSSATLLTQIKEGASCDIFFSAAQNQMNELEEEHLIKEGTRRDVLNNQVVVVTLKNSNTKVTGLSDIEKAESIALAGANVPVGKYTREALINIGKLEKVEDASKITTKAISEKLRITEISEQDNVSKVLLAVAEGSCEVGTIYYSDLYEYEDRLEILEMVSHDLTGNVTYPICLVENEEADEAKKKASEKFYEFILSEEAKKVFEQYYFDTNIE